LSRILTALIALLACAAALGPSAAASSVRDVAELKGMREHKVFGVGLVVGLRGTGDKGRETQKRIAILLTRMKFSVQPSDLPSKNVALVFVTARIRSDTPKGTRIDVTVSSMGDATSLAGGELLPTPLHTDNTRMVYARAQGTVSVGSGGHQTAGGIAKGATIEKEIPSKALDRFRVNDEGEKIYFLDLVISADKGNFALSNDIADAINIGLRRAEDSPVASAQGPTLVRVEVPDQWRKKRVAFVREIMNMPVVVDPPARVVINERSGVVVVTGNVRISPAEVGVNGLTVKLRAESTFSDLERGLSRLGGTDVLIAVLKELSRAGALQARLVSR
jgi:flagellar P-ring protein precursor FlgI